MTLRVPDALIVATGQCLGADAVLTADKKLRQTDPTLVELITA